MRSLAVVVAVALVMTQGPAFARQPDAPPSATGGLIVASDPAGAAVYVDGKLSGTTPATITGLAPGDHRVRLVADGYLENRRVWAVAAGESHTLHVKLTAAVGATAAVTPSSPGGGSFFASPILWGVVGGVAAAVLLTRDRNNAPVVSSVTATPSGTAMAGQTAVTIAVVASDPEGQSLSVDVDFGDGTAHATTLTSTHVYASPGTYAVKVTASDGKKSTAGPAASVTVAAGLAGKWTGGQDPLFQGVFGMTLTQNGATLGGSCDFDEGSNALIGTATPLAYPAAVNATCVIPDQGAGTYTYTFSGSATSATTMTGTISAVSSLFGNATATNQTLHK